MNNALKTFNEIHNRHPESQRVIICPECHGSGSICPQTKIIYGLHEDTEEKQPIHTCKLCEGSGKLLKTTKHIVEYSTISDSIYWDMDTESLTGGIV